MSKIEGGLLVARTLAEEGITDVSVLCGGHINPILHGCKELGIKVIDTWHEAAVVHDFRILKECRLPSRP